MPIIDFSEVLKIKDAVKEKFGEKVHFHDACGGQYFTLEKTNPEIVEFIKTFMLKQGYKADFDPKGFSFTLED